MMEESDQSYEISIEFTCRTCLKTEMDQVLIPVFENYDNTGITPFEIIEEFVFMKLKITKDDGLPQHICTDCMERLATVNSFRIECEKSQEFLVKYYQAQQMNATNDNDHNEEYSNFEFLSMHNSDFETRRMIIIKKEIMNVSGVEQMIKTEIKDKDESAGDESQSDDDTGFDLNEQESAEGDNENEICDLECNICGKTYKRRPHLERHMATHKNYDDDVMRRKQKFTSNYFCYKCGKRFSKSASLEDHENRGKCIPFDNPRCRYCKERFTLMKDLEEHLEKSHPKDRPHICPICKKTFQSVSNRNTHLQSHNKEGSFTCDICSQGFKSKVYLNKHKKSVHTVAHHTCPHCTMQFDNTVKFEYHLKSHDPNKKYKCKFCDKSFMQHHHLANHERTHTGSRPFLCNICGKDFKQESNFKLHLRIHSGVRPYVCSICSKDFIQRGSYVLHMRQHTGHRPFQCEHCGKDFIQKSTLNVHLRTHTGERPYKCESCDKAFAQAQQLKYHNHSAHNGPAVGKPKSNKGESNEDEGNNEGSHVEPIETKQKVYPYVCHLCNKGFKLPSSLSSHIKVHTEDRKHVCTQCGNTFKRAEHLRIHINGVHLKQKPYTCEICNKSFAQSGDRNIHMRRHTGEKPHTCSHCNKSFRLLKAMRAHQRIHTGEKPYHCEICKMDFMTYTALATHTMKHQETMTQNLVDVHESANKPIIKYEIVELMTTAEPTSATTSQIITLPIVVDESSSRNESDGGAGVSVPIPQIPTHIVLTMPSV